MKGVQKYVQIERIAAVIYLSSNQKNNHRPNIFKKIYIESGKL